MPAVASVATQKPFLISTAQPAAGSAQTAKARPFGNHPGVATGDPDHVLTNHRVSVDLLAFGAGRQAIVQRLHRDV